MHQKRINIALILSLSTSLTIPLRMIKNIGSTIERLTLKVRFQTSKDRLEFLKGSMKNKISITNIG